MNEPIDIESNAVAIRESQAVTQPLSLSEVEQRLDFIRQIMAKRMVEGTDYGKIPGCGDKPGLFQPGAQKLALTFQLAPTVAKEILRELRNDHREYEFTLAICAANGRVLAHGVGTCSTLEAKYRYRAGGRKCPECGVESIFKSKQGQGFYCWSKKGGCGAQFAANDTRIAAQDTGRVEHDNPADFWNTVRKMAFKRGLVHGMINATNTSELWSQDLEDVAEPASNFRQPKVETREAAGAGNVATPAATAQHTDDQRARFLQVITELLPESEKLAASYGWISPEHGLSSIAWNLVPTLTKSYVDWFRAECAKLKMQPPKTSDKTVARPPDWFWDVTVTVPRAGMKKKEYLQAPDTIRSLYDAGKGGDDAARKRLFGLAKEWAPKAYEYQGKTYEPSKEDHVCRDALDAFCEFEEKNSDDVNF